ncbi:hypothetical protein AVEN_161766-1 [Araneus ventricosus]|uniref:Uncharacterized protein n=1 Tax=Araneus ventricosus TaxID=182803 RepID=A0A4Y2RPZ3_ARAVE|nr:hypothetical protein AVEN_11145-1 [Araneus ventricosus]GBN76948.1 hypothetical protein AVEN_122220-1 [Araneus ventricosus]GBN76967.1 hypothetical protein AVEN_94078-1 [Araneus ventricosus]GBN76975.1 hypothetical protein AVEN_161766-1 [Araneus ventricosus]
MLLGVIRTSIQNIQLKKRNKRNLTDSIDEGNLGWVSGFGGAHKRWKARRVSLTNFRAFSWDLAMENVRPIQPVIIPRMFGTLGLVADSSFRLAGQLGMPGDISWLFSCFQINLTVTQAPGKSYSNAKASGTDG